MSAAARALAPLLLAAALAGCAVGPARTAAEVAPSLPAGAKLLPARVRRLTNLEIERSLAALTGLDVTIAAELPPDVRQEGYTPNASQDVSASWAARYTALVREIARRAARERLASLAPCHDGAASTAPSPAPAEPRAGATSCRARVVADLGRRAFRRPLDVPEQASLEAAFSAGEAEGSAGAGGSGPPAAPSGQGGALAGGLEVLLRTLAESPSFLYVSELGAGGAPGTRARLDAYELAATLSYMLRGGPPDDQLLDAARAGALESGAGRVREARRLLGMSDTRYQFRRFVLEWLEVDGLAQTAKSTRAFPRYEALKPHMMAETEGFVDEVMVHGGASVGALLGSGVTSVDPEMARFYGMHTYGPRASLAGTGRLGVLQQASFLAAHAHEDVTSPVKRGDFVMRKLLCEKIKRPAEIGLEIVMPAPSDALTNRQRFAAHAEVPGCAGCHAKLDALGFTFEGFDAMGGRQTSEHGHPVVTRASVALEAGHDGGDPHAPGPAGHEGGDPHAPGALALDDSAALTRALVDDPRVGACFARHAFRYFSAQADPRVEASFLALRGQLRARERDNLFETLLAYVASNLFVLREVEAP